MRKHGAGVLHGTNIGHAVGVRPPLPPDQTMVMLGSGRRSREPAPRPPICTSCRHCVELTESILVCARNLEAMPVDPVDGGRPFYRLPWCNVERRRRWFSFRDRCGPQGRYFEAVQKEGPERPAPPPSSND